MFQYIGFWLQQQVFTTQGKQTLPESIKITFLQIICLLLEVDGAIKGLLENQTIIQFVNDSITGIIDKQFSTTSNTTSSSLALVEEFLILLIVH